MKAGKGIYAQKEKLPQPHLRTAASIIHKNWVTHQMLCKSTCSIVIVIIFWNETSKTAMMKMMMRMGMMMSKLGVWSGRSSAERLYHWDHCSLSVAVNQIIGPQATRARLLQAHFECKKPEHQVKVQLYRCENTKSRSLLMTFVFCVQGLSFCDPVDPPVNLELISQVNLFPQSKFKR